MKKKDFKYQTWCTIVLKDYMNGEKKKRKIWQMQDAELVS